MRNLNNLKGILCVLMLLFFYNINAQTTNTKQEQTKTSMSANSPIEFVDIDSDGFDVTVDCNDYDPKINPKAKEIPYNSIDENCDGFDFIKTASSPTDKLTITPNPASEYAVLQIKGGLLKRNLEITIFDKMGELVHTNTINQGTTLCTVDVRTFYEGTYTVKIKDGALEYTQPLEVKKD